MSSTLYTSSAIWKGPEDLEKNIYFAGITQSVFNNLALENSYDDAYPDNTAFRLIGTSAADLGRIYYPSSLDTINIAGISNDALFGVDDDKNLIIFDENYALSDISNISVELVVNYASIYKSNLVSFDKILDFRNLKERAISCMVSSTNGIYLGGVSGKVWFFNGYYVEGPIFNTESDNTQLPVSAMTIHKFPYESDSYLYIGTDTKPRLFRAKVSTASSGSGWESVYYQNELAASTGGILSLLSAYNKLFIGCKNNRIFKYNRTSEILLSQPTNFLTEEVITQNTESESLTVYNLITSNIKDYEPAVFGIKTLEAGSSQVFAGIDNSPEVWSYSEITLKNPLNDEEWASTLFDNVFKNDPAPAQYYSYDNITISKNDSNIGVARLPDINSPQGFQELLVIKGNTRNTIDEVVSGSRFFEFAEGSDWEQLSKLNLPDQSFIDVHAASFEEITSLELSDIDGHTLLDTDLVLLKDQSDSNTIQNGLYRYNSVSGMLEQDFNIFYLYQNTSKLGFYVINGYINSGCRYLINTSDIINNINLNVYKPKYTLEFDFINLSSSRATDCTNLNSCAYLNDNELSYSAPVYEGYQGIEVSDLYGSYSLECNYNTLVLKSGTNSITKTLPVLGYIKTWDFYTGSFSASTQNWTIGSFVTSLTSVAESSSDIFGATYNKYVLRVEPATSGNPSIVIDNLDLDVLLDSVVIIRAKINPVDPYIALTPSKIKFYWSYENGQFTESVDVDIQTKDGYVEYIIKPTWKGAIYKLKIEFTDLPTLSARPEYIFIDYIKILNESELFDINNYISTVRVNVEDRDIKIWLNNQESPFINYKNFITLDTFNPRYIDSNISTSDSDQVYIKVGKINNQAGDSLFGFKRLQCIVGESYAPVTKEVNEFSLSNRFQSTGGIRLFTYHNGTLYSVTDGLESNKISDNPDDRQAKIYSYKGAEESWFQQSSPISRNTIFNSDGTYNLYGLIRPLTAVSYKGVLYLSGQYGNIKVT